MYKLFYILLFILSSVQLSSQQLYLEVYSGRDRSNYQVSPYAKGDWYFPLTARVAAGADHIQLGGEYSFSLTDPTFEIKDSLSKETLGTHEFKSSYYGLFLRGKFSRYPARRFGVTLTAGAGYINLDRVSDVQGEAGTYSYNRTFSYYGGAGVSIPTQGMGMIELGYSFHDAQFDATDVLPALNGAYHSIHLGFSLNFVFGKRAVAYQEIRKN